MILNMHDSKKNMPRFDSNFIKFDSKLVKLDSNFGVRNQGLPILL